jgi:dimethylargininase
MRAVPRSLERGERTFVERQPIDLGRAAQQHAAYRRHLSDLGFAVHVMPAEPHLPDSAFVEDTAVLLDELVVVTLPGAPSRRPEVQSVADRLREWRTLRRIEEPGTLDGGDVMRVDRTLFVGRTRRTNAAGITQLTNLVAEWGYEVVPVSIEGCLHLKSACTWIGEGTVLVNRGWIEAGALRGVSTIEVDAGEPGAANVLFLPQRGTVIAAAEYPVTAQRLRDSGRTVMTVAISEFLKAEAAVTCLSLIL